MKMKIVKRTLSSNFQTPNLLETSPTTIRDFKAILPKKLEQFDACTPLATSLHYCFPLLKGSCDA
jgi:hypothetical protein